MKRFVINLYFGFERLWCYKHADTIEEAEEFARDWSDQFVVRPSETSVYLAP